MPNQQRRIPYWGGGEGGKGEILSRAHEAQFRFYDS